MRARRTITFSTFTGTLRPHHSEAYVPFVIDTAPIGFRPAAQASPLATDAALALLDDTDTRRGTPCPLCFVERAVAGNCDSH